MKWQVIKPRMEWRIDMPDARLSVEYVTGAFNGPYYWSVMPMENGKARRLESGRWQSIGKGYRRKLAEAKQAAATAYDEATK